MSEVYGEVLNGLSIIETDDGEKGTIIDACDLYNDALAASFMKLADKIHK